MDTRLNTSRERAQTDRVRAYTPENINRRIDEETEERLALYPGLPEQAVSLRIAELDQEWDIERTLNIQAAFVALLGIVLGLTRGRKWLLLAAANQLFVFQHALLGWSPPAVLHRLLGVRTRQEINAEKMALKTLRGDFDPASASLPAGELLTAARRGGAPLSGSA
jgi:hypothetical protein